ncbi:penicillin-binding transpeptidase domain-containing protein [Paenibacillus silvae]|uniref:penicillin-binding transpeptidase domain-containing protein n=1 Tax=Paenibacillus silvae TaxID=1325358 RepID=UPI002005F320|nr:penicillin-binding transpeptidase domain-containing protein [Paenibacillus silvae]MCK6077461.1 penicillin-binding transpeptidase domain-containing protein [Paenibacillus silvae]MCK6151807.1 penicillin-binding transpeptidase domain-containing protein [Paenibacillus silvae]MCK6270293.1 penicillin-binding transpeptidase domain-containing protein [Paenibacillus silvae]
MRSKRKLLYGLLPILFAGGIGMYLYMQNNKPEEAKPQTTVNQYIEHLQKKEFDQLYSLMSPASLTEAGMTKEQFVEKYNAIYTGMQVSDIKAELQQMQGAETEAGADAGANTDQESVSEAKTGQENDGKTQQNEGNPDLYEANYNLHLTTFLGDISETHTLKLVRQELEDGSKIWQINWQPSLILSDMVKGSKVRVKTLFPTRGNIVDRDGLPLATQGTMNEWGIVPEKLGDQPDQMIARIADHYNVTVEGIQKALNQTWVKPGFFVPIGSTEEFDVPDSLRGVALQSKEVRYYPLGEAAAHLIGYVRKATKEDLDKDTEGYYRAEDWIGKAGLEQSMEKQLRGERGALIEITDEAGNTLSELIRKDAVDGKDVQLTISSAQQKRLYQTLSGGGDAGAMVMMNPKDGNLLALVSAPSYDPNKMVTGLTQAEWDAYSANEKLPFINRVTTRYAPGSTFKAITAAAGLMENVTTADKTHDISGLQWRKDDSWGGYYVKRVKSLSPVNMVDALVYSDNIYFAMEATEMGSAKFIEGIQKFGFGDNFGMDELYLKPSQYANEAHKDLSSEVLLADTSYGQGEMLMSPIHLAAAFTPFVNEGKLVKPVLIVGKETSDPAAIITPDVANTVKNALKEVVSRQGGTAHALSSIAGGLAGKTGTAELKAKKGEQGRENGFFVTFDTESPSFLLAAVIEEVNGRGGSHYVVDRLKPFLEKLQFDQ